MSAARRARPTLGPWRNVASPTPPAGRNRKEQACSEGSWGLTWGVATDHTAVILDQTGAELGRRRVRPTRASLEALREVALAGAQTETVLEVVIEPTGPAWLPVAVFFAATGDVVYRVSSQKAADLRR